MLFQNAPRTEAQTLLWNRKKNRDGKPLPFSWWAPENFPADFPPKTGQENASQARKTAYNGITKPGKRAAKPGSFFHENEKLFQPRKWGKFTRGLLKELKVKGTFMRHWKKCASFF